MVVAPTLPTQGRIRRAGRVTTQGMVEGADLSADLARPGLGCGLAAPGDMPPAVRVPIAGPVPGLIGTDHRVARRQAPRLAATGVHHVLSIGPDGRGVRDVAVRMACGDPWAVTVVLPPDTDRATAAVTIRQILAALPAPLPRPGPLLARGGATLQGVADVLGAHGIGVRGEQDAGIPAGALSGGRWDGLALLSKSGGVGGPEALRQDS